MPFSERHAYARRATAALSALWVRLDGSLRARILIPTTILFTLTLLAVGFTALHLYTAELERSQRERAESVAEMLVRGYTAMKLESGAEDTRTLLVLAQKHRPEIGAVSIVRPDGAISLSSHPALEGTRPWKELGHLATAGAPQIVDTREPSTYAALWPLYNEPSCARCHATQDRILGWLDVRFSKRSTDAARRELARALISAGAPGLLLLIGIALWLLDREAVAPLRRLIGVMKKAEAGDLDVTADDGRPDELGTAARSFDAMLHALRRAQGEVESLYKDHMIRADRFAGVGELAAHLAHEIKNPLAGLSGALELLSEDLKNTPNGPITEEMRHQVDRLARTMESLLSYARPPKVRLRRISVGAAIEKVLFLVGQQRRRAGRIEVVTELSDTLPAALADPSQLEQVLLNLCLNAAQAMPEGGTLTVRAFPGPKDDRLTIEVADTGPGIPPDVRSGMFKPFFTTKRNGNGLGLAISARIIAEHQGEISFRCPPEGGTIFSVTLRTFPTGALEQEGLAA